MWETQLGDQTQIRRASHAGGGSICRPGEITGPHSWVRSLWTRNTVADRTAIVGVAVISAVAASMQFDVKNDPRASTQEAQ